MVDAMIVLYESTEKDFITNGLGSLADASKCTVVEERNGSYELEMEYPVTGRRFSDIQLRRIIFAKPNAYAGRQPFRIYNITKPMNGTVTVSAEHISYDLAGYPVGAFSAENASDALGKMQEAAVVSCPFIFFTDNGAEGSLEVAKPTNMRSVLGGEDDSVLSVYGGEYEFDVWNVRLHAQRGEDRGVSIRYGKNMTDFSQEESSSEVYTGVYPFWSKEVEEDDLYEDDPGFVDLPEKVVDVPGDFDFTRVYPLDLSEEWPPQEEREDGEEWNAVPTEEQLRELAVKYIGEHDIGVPKVSLTVSFEQLAQSEEYKLLARLDDVRLCDTVGVEFPEMGVSATFKCIKTTYNALTDKYESIEFGEAKSNLANTVLSQDRSIKEKSTKAYTQKVVENSASTACAEARMAYSQANAAYNKANSATTTAELAIATANQAYQTACLTNLAYSQANAAYNQANLAHEYAVEACVQACTAAGEAGSASARANAAYNQATNAYSQANTAYNRANAAYSQANNAYTRANTAYNQANNAYTRANSAYTQANTANNTASNAYAQANAAYNQANAAMGQSASAAYNQANNAYTRANSAYNQANSAYSRANTAYNQANSAYNQANKISALNLAFGNSASAAGNRSTAMGVYANASGNFSVAIGYHASASGINSVAIGSYAISSNANSIQLGNATTLSKIYAKVGITTTSDERDKADITEIADGAVEFLKRVRAIRYVLNNREMYIGKYSLLPAEIAKKKKFGLCNYDREAHALGTKKRKRVRVGVSAQNTQKALEEVYGDSSYANLIDDNLFDFPPDEIPEGVESQLTANYDAFIPFVIKAVQEIDARLEKIEGVKERSIVA